MEAFTILYILPLSIYDIGFFVSMVPAAVATATAMVHYGTPFWTYLNACHFLLKTAFHIVCADVRSERS